MFLKRFRKAKPQSEPYGSAGEYVSAYRATGDLTILGELYERHMELVYAVCYNYLRDEEEAKDAVMHLFEQLVTDLRRHDVQQFQPWLHSVARNYCLMQLRSRKTQPVASFVDADDLNRRSDPDDTDEGWSPRFVLTDYEPGTRPETELEEDLTRMEACLQTLPAEQKTCLTLFYLDRKTYNEVADLTGYTLKQVKSYLQNGRRNLKICMSR